MTTTRPTSRSFTAHLTEFCDHPGEKGAGLGYCKYCRMKKFHHATDEEIKDAYYLDMAAVKPAFKFPKKSTI